MKELVEEKVEKRDKMAGACERIVNRQNNGGNGDCWKGIVHVEMDSDAWRGRPTPKFLEYERYDNEVIFIYIMPHFQTYMCNYSA